MCSNSGYIYRSMVSPTCWRTSSSSILHVCSAATCILDLSTRFFEIKYFASFHFPLRAFLLGYSQTTSISPVWNATYSRVCAECVHYFLLHFKNTSDSNTSRSRSCHHNIYSHNPSASSWYNYRSCSHSIHHDQAVHIHQTGILTFSESADTNLHTNNHPRQEWMGTRWNLQFILELLSEFQCGGCNRRDLWTHHCGAHWSSDILQECRRTMQRNWQYPYADVNFNRHTVG